MGSSKITSSPVSSATVRRFDWDRDRRAADELERSCEMGSSPSPPARISLVAIAAGDPLCRVRHFPCYEMLVAEVGSVLAGIIRGTIKTVATGTTAAGGGSPEITHARVGYILGLRVSPLHRRQGIAMSLVRAMEEWFAENAVEYSYMATEKRNEASVNLFTEKLGYVKFRRPEILINPVGQLPLRLSSGVTTTELTVDQAELLYRRWMSSTEFFPLDIDRILRSKMSLGTWVAHRRGERWPEAASWAAASLWNCSEIFKLRVDSRTSSAPWLAKAMGRVFPCIRVPAAPAVVSSFGFFFLYGLHAEGPEAALMVKGLCHFAHNMAMQMDGCEMIVTEIAGGGGLRRQVPHRRWLSCSGDLWCIKSLGMTEKAQVTSDWTRAAPPPAIFVDPREI
ncbi:hypothetical protein AXF42_Ash008118 [Apostasia shenzhenica]|uniref:N-acetyltransferase domain-containing protein n=1 Tax=Apostasia shenzhenica TaxID=1088818 RepID=A0A2I0A8L0_9ASPA|nr:hypothetical protein AXF42_Ash008118 [Apostasia shenzhenica]